MLFTCRKQDKWAAVQVWGWYYDNQYQHSWLISQQLMDDYLLHVYLVGGSVDGGASVYLT